MDRLDGLRLDHAHDHRCDQLLRGPIAAYRDEYYVLHGDQLVVFDTTTWGWLMMIFGVLLFLVGLGLASKQGGALDCGHPRRRQPAGEPRVARQPATRSWTLTVVALEIVVLYALTARWSDVAAY